MDGQKTSWASKRLLPPYETIRRVITIRVSQRVLNYFKQHGKGYQSRINAILEAYVTAQEGE